MVKVRKVNAALLDQPKQAKERAPTPAQLARQKREGQLRQLVEGLTRPNEVFLVTPSDGEKPSTIRSALQRVARELDRERDLIVRKHEDGFFVALSTPEREATRRGRRPTGGTGS